MITPEHSRFLLNHFYQINKAFDSMDYLFKQLGNAKTGHMYKLDIVDTIPPTKSGCEKVIIHTSTKQALETGFLELSSAHENLKLQLEEMLETTDS